MIHGIVRIIAFALMRLCAPTRVYGKENIKSGNVIFVCNHQSMVDAFVIFTYLPSKTFYMAKKQLFKNKLFAYLLKKTKVFAVDRDRTDLTAVKFACNVLKENNNLCIFPQGTRKSSPKIDLADMHNGIGMIALREKSTVIPLMFKEKPRFFKRNTLYIGEPLDLTAFEDVKATSKTMSDFAEYVGVKMNELLEKSVSK